MSLFTLLEAARYLEYKSEASARGEEPHDYTTFTQLSSAGTSVSSPTSSSPSIPATPTSSNSNGATTNNLSAGVAGGQCSPVGFSVVFNQTNLPSTPSTTSNIQTLTTAAAAAAAATATTTTTTTTTTSNAASSSNSSSSRGTPPPVLLSSTPVTVSLSVAQSANTTNTNLSTAAGAVTTTATTTTTTAVGTSPISIGVGVIQQAGPYRQRSGSATSRHRTDSLSSHEENSRDQKQIRRIGGAGTREVHNKLEKNRRAHLKECFESLKKQLPNIQDDKKTSNLTILRSALRYIQTLKKKEREFEQQLEKLAGDKISAQHRLANLRKDGCSVLPLGTEIIASGHLLEPRRALLAATSELVAAERLMSEIKRRGSVSPDNETTTTASECGNLSDYEADEFDLLSSTQHHQNGTSKKTTTEPRVEARAPIVVSTNSEPRVNGANLNAQQQASEDCKPITISVASATSNPIYQQATKGQLPQLQQQPTQVQQKLPQQQQQQQSQAQQQQFPQTPSDTLTPLIKAGPGLIVRAAREQDYLDIKGNTFNVGKIDKKVAAIQGERSYSTGGGSVTGAPVTFLDSKDFAKVEVTATPLISTPTSCEPPRAIFTPGNQKTILPTYLPNTGNLATLLHAANTVSYIKAPQSNGEVTVSVSTPGPHGAGGLTSIPLMCKPGSVVRLAPSGHIVQPLTLVQQIPQQNGVQNNQIGGTNKTGPAPTLFLTQSTGSGQVSGQYKASNHATQATTMATVITQTPLATATAGGPGSTVVVPQNGLITAGNLNQLGKVQLGGTTTLSIKPVSQFPIISGQQFITTSSQSLKPVVVVSVPQTSTQ